MDPEHTPVLVLQQEIYLNGCRNTSTESCNFFPLLLWEPSRQNYLTVVIMGFFASGRGETLSSVSGEVMLNGIAGGRAA